MILNLIKPSGISSHSLVNRVRKITGERRVGHGGTLDPMASGVLIVGVGRESTKQLQDILKNTQKEYLATIELGKVSDTDDAEGDISPSGDVSKLNVRSINKALFAFVGEQMQTPPNYSAIKIRGTPAYKLARGGKSFVLKKRPINIYKLELIGFKPPLIIVKATVSSGTYIRSLARDMGNALGVGGYLKSLTRIRVGNFVIENGLTLDALAKEVAVTNTNN